MFLPMRRLLSCGTRELGVSEAGTISELGVAHREVRMHLVSADLPTRDEVNAAERVNGALISGNLFGLLGEKPEIQVIPVAAANGGSPS